MIDLLTQTREVLAAVDLGEIHSISSNILATSETGGRIFIFGNGGSLTTASHFACDLLKVFKTIKRKLHLQVFDAAATITMLANDYSYAKAIREWLESFNLSINDCIIAISVSGSSSNIGEALRYARPLSTTVLLTGENTPEVSVDYVIKIRSRDYGVVENCHLAICHEICNKIKSLMRL